METVQLESVVNILIRGFNSFQPCPDVERVVWYQTQSPLQRRCALRMLVWSWREQGRKLRVLLLTEYHLGVGKEVPFLVLELSL